MTFDDNHLIEQLQAGIVERQSGISAPDGIGDHARRAARKRTATRAVSAGVPVLAAAGVATVIATSSGSAARSGGGAGHPIPVVSGGPVNAKDTSYIVKRVKENLADADPQGMVIDAVGYASGRVGSDGSLADLGSDLDDAYLYAAPNGTTYMHSVWNGPDGTPTLTGSNVLVPDGSGDGKGTDTRTLIDPADHTYSQQEFSGVSDPESGQPTPNLGSTPSEVQQALQSDQVTQVGETTVNGTQAIALSITVPGAWDESLTLYVNAQTYQPLRTVTTNSGESYLEVADWLPATTANVALATDDSIPSGYTKVDSVP